MKAGFRVCLFLENYPIEKKPRSPSLSWTGGKFSFYPALIRETFLSLPLLKASGAIYSVTYVLEGYFYKGEIWRGNSEGADESPAA